MPEFGSGLGVERNQASFHHEERLGFAVERGENRSRVGGAVRACFPNHVAAARLEGEKGLILASAGDDDAVADDQGRGGVAPVNFLTTKLLDQIAFPQDPAGGGVERVQIESSAKNKDPAVGVHRRGARAVTAVVARSTPISTPRVIGNSQRGPPEYPAGSAVNSNGRLARRTSRRRGQDGERHTAARDK